MVTTRKTNDKLFALLHIPTVTDNLNSFIRPLPQFLNSKYCMCGYDITLVAVTYMGTHFL